MHCASISNFFRTYLCKVIKIIATLVKNRNIMTVERETAGFALPFAAGTAAAIYAGASYITPSSLTLTGGLIVILTVLLSLGRQNRLPDNAIWALIGATALFVGALCGLTSIELSDSAHSGLGLFERIGMSIEEAADQIPFRNTTTNAFIKAVLTGERSGISQDVMEAFRESGASHILALSGLHLGVIYMMISRLLSITGSGPRAIRIRSVLTIIICGTYTLATGAGPSLVRAFLFIILNETARLCGRYSSTGNVLLTALVIQLCMTPAAIRDAGFQLSYAAMAGIAFIYPWMKGLWPETPKGRPGSERLASYIVTQPTRWIWNSATMSIACQMTTAPLAWIYFGTFPQYFLLTNLVALPLTGMLIPSAAITLILNKAQICPDLLVRLTEWLTGLLIGALEIIASL